MSRETRLILIIGLGALVGLVALGAMAQRYRAVLSARGGAPVDAAPGSNGHAEFRLGDVDRFINIRRGIEQALPRDADGVVLAANDSRAAALWPLRDRLIAEQGWTQAGYRRVRGAYREWRNDGSPVAGGARSLFGSRRLLLDKYDLGAWEGFDL